LRALVDTNIVMDVLLARRPFVDSASRVFSLVEESKIEASLCATTVTTVDYLLTQSLSRDEARQALRGLLKLFEIAPVNRSVIEKALRSKIEDLEDAILEQAAWLVGAEAIITRNTKGFHRSSIKALDPAELLAAIEM
jgi:predicted nucleic acid-binding protein